MRKRSKGVFGICSVATELEAPGGWDQAGTLEQISLVVFTPGTASSRLARSDVVLLEDRKAKAKAKAVVAVFG